MIQFENEQLLLQDCVRCFRLGMEGMAGDRFAKYIDVLQERLAGLAPGILVRLTPVLSEILLAQQRRDFIWVADLMEYRLRPLVYD